MKAIFTLLFLLPTICFAQLIVKTTYATYLYKKPFAKLQPTRDDIYDTIPSNERMLATGIEAGMIKATFRKNVGYVPSENTTLTNLERLQLLNVTTDGTGMLEKATEIWITDSIAAARRARMIDSMKEARSLATKQVQNRYEGLGNLRIGFTTTSLLNEIYLETNVKPVERENYHLAYDASTLPQVKSYTLPSYEISPFVINNVELSFYKDTLFAINFNIVSTEFIDAMDMKFGKAKLDVIEKTIVCRNGLGIRFTEQEKGYLHTWKTKHPGVVATYYLGHYFDDKCEKQEVRSFTFENATVNTKLERMARERQAKDDAEKRNNLKASLKDF